MEPYVGDERAMLEAVLDTQRGEVAAILDGLDERAARARLVPSRTTPLTLVKHACFVERVWFQHRVDGASREELGLPTDVDDSFVLAPDDTITSVRADFLAACARSREIAAQHDLDEQFAWYDKVVSLRWIHLQLIREYARHAGHGDILVEQLAAADPSAS